MKYLKIILILSILQSCKVYSQNYSGGYYKEDCINLIETKVETLFTNTFNKRRYNKLIKLNKHDMSNALKIYIKIDSVGAVKYLEILDNRDFLADSELNKLKENINSTKFCVCVADYDARNLTKKQLFYNGTISWGIILPLAKRVSAD